MKKFCTILFACLIMTSISFAQSKKEKKAAESAKKYQEMLKLIESKDYEFEAEWANPQSGRNINLTTNPNFFRIIKDSANIFLPYFGRSFSGGAAMTGEGGIVFNGTMEGYEMSVNEKKQKIMVQFRGKTKTETYTFNLTIFGGGNTMINVNSNYRSVIKYDGRTQKPKPKAKE